MKRLIGAGTVVVAAIASFGTTYAACRLCGAQAAPAILAAILAISLSRRGSPASAAHLAASVAGLASLAVVATGIGRLLHSLPVLGAAVFTAGMFLSVWLRNFGGRARYAGAVIAMPLVAMLVVPVATRAAPGGPLVDLALGIFAGVTALGYVTVVQWLARRAGVGVVAAERPADAAKAEQPKRAGLSPPTRMALQMAVALAAAFAVGFSVFPAHWGWAVLTAFIVCSGARGRGDALYKGVLRLAGAVAGTLAAAALGHVWAPAGIAEASAIFIVLFVGLWLRDYNYAYWASCTTLILAILQGANAGGIALLGVRLEAILLGALCGVAAAWFVVPIRTEAIVRRRIADALRAFDEVVAQAHLSDGERTRRLALFEHRMAELELVAPPVRWHRRIFASGAGAEHPAQWIELTRSLGSHAAAFGPEGDRKRSMAVRRAIGISRRAIANHGNPDKSSDDVTVGASLCSLRDVVASGHDR
ncbi:MAG: FUSC family protein [Candidatus Eremiobacteraeota bacterium]|nr:FUSC family protein [Candidatus Eremiobacteraeota bacterium]